MKPLDIFLSCALSVLGILCLADIIILINNKAYHHQSTTPEMCCGPDGAIQSNEHLVCSSPFSECAISSGARLSPTILQVVEWASGCLGGLGRLYLWGVGVGS